MPSRFQAKPVRAAPVFAANLIFAETFANTGAARTGFAWNLLGIMAGGLLEYSSLVIGYNNLILVVTLLYAGALGLQMRGARRTFVVSPAE